MLLKFIVVRLKVKIRKVIAKKMSFSQNNLSFQDDDDEFISQASQYNFQDFTMPDQTQASQLEHNLGSQVSFCAVN